MNRTINLLKVAILALLMTFMVFSCIIQNPKQEDCVSETIKVVRITKGSAYDIVFYDRGTDYFYINRGLQQGLNLDSLNAKVLNKTVTLHLAKILGGITSEHISQFSG